RSDGAGNATTRNTRGLTRSVSALITPPLPAASRPSKTTTIRAPSAFTQSCKAHSSTCSARSPASYCLRVKRPCVVAIVSSLVACSQPRRKSVPGSPLPTHGFLARAWLRDACLAVSCPSRPSAVLPACCQRESTRIQHWPPDQNVPGEASNASHYPIPRCVRRRSSLHMCPRAPCAPRPRQLHAPTSTAVPATPQAPPHPPPHISAPTPN